MLKQRRGNPSPCYSAASTPTGLVRAEGGRKFWVMKSQQMSETQMKTELGPRPCLHSIGEATLLPWWRWTCFFNDLLSPSSTTRALKQLYDIPAARDPSATIALEIQLGASAPNYKWGWRFINTATMSSVASSENWLCRHSQSQVHMRER